MRRFVIALLPVLVVATLAAAAQAQPSKKERERKAQAAFVAGRYDEAARALTALYADFHEPLYLRNLGRAYQKLRDPDRAITSFEDYLRQAPNLTQTERDEVRGFIREMEELRRQQAPAPPPPPPPVLSRPVAPVATPVPPPTVTAPLATPVPAAEPPPLVAPPPPAVVLAPAPPVEPAPKRGGTARTVGYVSLGAAALLAGGGAVFLASSWSEYNRGKNEEGCPGFYVCNKIADRVKARALWGKVLFGAAAVVAVVGGTALYLSFSDGGAETRASVALGGTF